jgi:hypothetical protein
MSKSFKQFLIEKNLNETPLPDDWDKEMYNERIPFIKRIKYAMDRAKRIGGGSSRVAFVIPYEGRETVLKVAKNVKGMAQNEHEVDALNDYYLRNLGLVIPIIDYDELNSKPTWIHMELARKATLGDFKRETGGTPQDLVDYANAFHGKNKYAKKPDNINSESELVQDFVDYAGNYDHPLGDYTRLSNWGVYNGRLVIIDIGLSDDIYTTYYSK